jgi:hypothetical protein
MGYFALVDACDIFVVYDDVQFSHQSWQHRNRIRNQEGWMWLTVPIIRNEKQLINEVMIDNHINWRMKHYKSIVQNYSSAPYYEQYIERFEGIYRQDWEKLVDLNVALIKELAALLNIRVPKIVKSSEMETSGQKTDRLLPILKSLGADTYISGVAAKDYLEVNKLNDAGIKVFWFEYHHPVYPQKGEFISYLSAIDLLLNTGEKAIDYIRQGVNLVEAKA